MYNKNITIWDIIYIAKKRWWIILITTIILAAGAYLYSYYTYVPMYKSSTMLYVYPNNTQEISSISAELSAINYAKQMMNTYIEILKTNDFLSKIETEINQEEKTDNKYTSSDIKKMMEITAIPNTQLFNVSITSKSPVDAYFISQKIAELAPQKIVSKLKVNVVEVVEKSSIPHTPYNDKNLIRNSVIGGFLGFVISLSILILINVFDITIRTEEDIKTSYDLPILGVIPDFQKLYNKKKRGSAKK